MKTKILKTVTIPYFRTCCFEMATEKIIHAYEGAGRNSAIGKTNSRWRVTSNSAPPQLNS